MISVCQVLLLMVMAPFVQGYVQWLKARIQGRIGPSPLKPWRDLRKQLAKEVVLSNAASWVSRLVPYLSLGLVLGAAACLPVLSGLPGPLLGSGSIFLFLSLLAFSRLSLLLLGLDSGSAFAGMGAGRDLLFSLLVEPTIFISLLAVGLPADATAFPGILRAAAVNTSQNPAVASLALVAIAGVILVETGRLPVDNPDTHLELTMVHESFLLESSGRYLALLSFSAQLRQLLWYTVLFAACFPWGINESSTGAGFAIAILSFLIKVLFASSAVAVIEGVFAKWRVFAVPRYLTFLLGLAVAAMLADAIL